MNKYNLSHPCCYLVFFNDNELSNMDHNAETKYILFIEFESIQLHDILIAEIRFRY